jgi:hypothetical protein
MHLEPSECLQCKAEAYSGEKRGWFWVKMGLDLSKHHNVARGVAHLYVFIKISHATIIRAQLTYYRVGRRDKL